MKKVVLLPHAEKRRQEICPHFSAWSIREKFHKFINLTPREVGEIGLLYSHRQEFKISPFGDFVFITEQERGFVTIVTIRSVAPQFLCVLRHARQNR